jgi:hypothetical protein
MLEPKGFSTYREAASIFRAPRSKGVAVTTTDVLIAAIALEHGTTLFTLDKDFTRIAGIIRLPLYAYCQAAHALAQQATRREFAKRGNRTLRKGLMFDFHRWFRV